MGNNVKLVAQKISNHALYPVCKVEGKSFRTFDNKTLPLYLDQCFHVLAADCSKQQQYGILARQLQQSSQQKEVKIYLGQSEIRITPVQQTLKVVVNGQEQQVQQNQWQPLRSAEGVKLGQILLTQNNVVQVYAPYYSLALTFDGENIAVETSQWLKGQQCGICGNNNQQPKDDLEGPQYCMYSEAEIQNAAWRVQNQPQECHKQHSIKTKISKSLKAQNGPCTILKHAVLRRPNQVCLSKKQVTQCAAGCQPSHTQLLEKQIPFTCLKDDRVAQHYVQKAERGEKLPELQQRPTTFDTKVPQ